MSYWAAQKHVSLQFTLLSEIRHSEKTVIPLYRDKKKWQPGIWKGEIVEL